MKKIIVSALLALPLFAQAGRDARHAPGVVTFENTVRVSVNFAKQSDINNRSGHIDSSNYADLGYEGSFAPGKVYGSYDIQCPTEGYGYVERVDITEEVSVYTDKDGKQQVVYATLKKSDCEINDYGG